MPLPEWVQVVCRGSEERLFPAASHGTGQVRRSFGTIETDEGGEETTIMTGRLKPVSSTQEQGGLAGILGRRLPRHLLSSWPLDWHTALAAWPC
jgi:hypothetical protein